MGAEENIRNQELSMVSPELPWFDEGELEIGLLLLRQFSTLPYLASNFRDIPTCKAYSLSKRRRRL